MQQIQIGGAIVGEEYFPLDHTDYSKTTNRITSSGAEVAFNTIVKSLGVIDPKECMQGVK